MKQNNKSITSVMTYLQITMILLWYTFQSVKDHEFQTNGRNLPINAIKSGLNIIFFKARAGCPVEAVLRQTR